MGVSSDGDKPSVPDVDPVLPAGKENESTEPERTVVLEPDVVMEVDRLDDVVVGSGSGIKIESSTALPRRAISVVQLFSLTITGFALCQHRLVTAC